MATTINTTLKTIVSDMLNNAASGKLDEKALKEIATSNNATIDEVKALYKECKNEKKAIAKEKKVAELKEKFDNEHSCFYYKNERVVLNLQYVKSANLYIWKGLDKNAICYAENKDGALSFGVVSSTVSKNGEKWRKALVQGNKSKCLSALNDITKGLDFDSFDKLAKTFKNTKEIEYAKAPKSIRALFPLESK